MPPVLKMMRPRLVSIARSETLARRAYAALRTSIRTGVLGAGTFYSEVQIAEELHISRTPVREALIELSREGIIEIVPQRGFRLRTISEAQMREVFELRGLIESYVVRRLASEASPGDVRSLRKILDRQATLVGDSNAFLETDEEFHLAMPTLLGLERTSELLKTLRGIMWLSGSLAISRPQRVRAVLAEHREVLERIAAGDADRAVEAVRNHTAQTADAAGVTPHSVAARTPRPARRR